MNISRSNSLERNAFAVLSATTRDARPRIIELAEAKGLTLDPQMCANARQELTNPRTRLSAEVAWLPGLSPNRAASYCRLLVDNRREFLEKAQQEESLSRANLLAAALEFFDVTTEVSEWAHWVTQLALQSEAIEPDDVLRLINEDRRIARFPEVQGIDLIELELSKQRRQYVQTVRDGLNRLPLAKRLQIITTLVDTTTHSGDKHAPTLIDDLVDGFQLDVQSVLNDKLAYTIGLVEATRRAASTSKAEAGSLVDKLAVALKEWKTLTLPIQLSLKARGVEHALSTQLSYKVRSLSVYLFNEHDMFEQTKRLTDVMQNVFAELPEVSETLDQDAEIIESLFKTRQQAKLRTEEWAREITYEGEIGLLFKDKLRISPEGIEWKGRIWPLTSVTRVRWGGTRHYRNGVYTGTEYIISFGTDESAAKVTTKREQVYSAFTERLWKAVCSRLITEFLTRLRKQGRMQFAGVTLEDRGIILIKHHHIFRANDQVYLTWSQVHIWSDKGSLYIGSRADKKTYIALSYQTIDNVHILAAVLRMQLKTNNQRLSSLLDDENESTAKTTRPNSSQKGRRKDVQSEVILNLEDVVSQENVQTLDVLGTKIRVKIPAGVDTGERLRYRGMGGSCEGGAPGDLYVTVKVLPHATFERKGKDLHCSISIPYAEAKQGIVAEIPSLGSRPARQFKIPAGTSANQVFRFQGQGVNVARTNEVGDLFVQISVSL